MAESVATLLLRSAQIDRATCKVLDAAPELPDTVIGFHARQYKVDVLAAEEVDRFVDYMKGWMGTSAPS